MLALAANAAIGSATSVQCFSASEQAFGPEDHSLGFLRVTASVTHKAGASLLGFSVSMPDSPEILDAEHLVAESASRGVYRFHFVDGWGNKGKGSLALSGRKATLDLNVEQEAEGGNNVRRNYGTFVLKQSKCPRP